MKNFAGFVQCNCLTICFQCLAVAWYRGIRGDRAMRAVQVLVPPSSRILGIFSDSGPGPVRTDYAAPHVLIG